MLFKKPGMSLIAMLTLALGIGANSAIFSIVRDVLLRPLPFHAPEQLIGIRESKVGEGHSNPLAWRSFFALRDQTKTLESVAAYLNWNPDIERDDGTIRLSGTQVSYEYFHVMGARPLLGRDFTPADNKPDATPTVMLSYELWQQMYGGEEDVLGQTLRIDGRNFTIIGVMPPIAFNNQDIGEQIGWRSIWTAFRINEARAQNSPGRLLKVNARMKEGVPLARARADLETIMEGLKQAYPETHGSEIGIYASELKDYVVDPNAQRAIWVLFGAVVFVLLIACGNVANLMLARGAEREKEIAVRAALGASRFAIVRLLLTESLLLSAGGAAAGWFLAHWLVVAISKFIPNDWQQMGHVQLDAGVFGFTLFLAVLTGLLFGLAPALGASKIDLNDALKSGARTASAGGAQRRLRSALVVLEVALALVLLAGSGLLLKSFARLRSVELGFNPDNVLTMSLRLPNSRFTEPQQRVSFFQRTLSNVKQLPGVESAAICFSLLMTGDIATDPVVIEGRAAIPKGEEPVLRGGSISADYFQTMGIKILRGRSFTEQEAWQESHVIIVNDAFAQRFFLNEDPIGKRIKVGIRNPPWSTIVGVAANHIQPGVDNRVWEEMFYPYVNTADPPLSGMNLVVKTLSDPAAMTPAVTGEVRKLDHLLPIAKIRTMSELTADALKSDRFIAGLIGSFALLALLLAAIGIYGVMAYSVTRRTQELGIRLALGATQNSVVLLVLQQGAKMTLVGIIVGLGVSSVLMQLMKALLFGVSAADPPTFLLITLLLSGVALIACYLPARRATKVDPMIALRHE